ncbi:oxidoreductase [uncultured Jatrophihabitans sp.]|uniref:oxidoreductase n=1 Tax=uncultured Jatrophihabitans sp. TaxID=1610747 RepID=UPI0035CAB630
MPLLNLHRPRAGTLRTASRSDTGHLRDFVRTRVGVEAYLEPRTPVTEASLVLVAGDGECTRRRVPNPRWAEAFARKHAMRCYDVAAVGYPERMRAYRR